MGNQKVVAIHQPNYLPWIGFFYKMSRCDTFVLLDNVRHSKSSFTHRNKINNNGKELLLTIPLKNKESLINELRILDPKDTLRKHWSAIKTNYTKSKHWGFLYADLERIYQTKYERLIDLNSDIIFLVKSKLEINTQILFASELGEIPGTGNERNLNICKALNATVYLSGNGAKSYNDEASYEKNNILLRYYDFVHPVYPQVGATFVPNLSIVDYLFNCGESCKEFFR